ncbi:hypothetical protein CYMTET_14617 [Cymbomonas tetramitiformis]|uniref:Reverse transcriptase domain-containing protein n=1 Tax=Cymbomonas tetramitiformis TaxID=36881 RepID=A0AAE0L9U1_9CHLO|nr:hypothetical protein CYMTET_14617 [Cymbomonas tetramitiformis]
MMAKRDPDSEESAFAATATDLPKSDPSQPPSDNQDADVSPEWTLKFQAFMGEKYKTELSKKGPPSQRAYKKSAEELRQLRDRIETLMAKDRIRPSANPYAAPCLMIPNPGNPKELRLAIDHRMLNKQTVKDKYPLPDIQVMFDEMHGVKFFSSFDAVDGFRQVPMAPGDVEKTAFTTHMGSATAVGFEELKAALIFAPVLALPNTKGAADGSAPFVVQTDASGIALGGCSCKTTAMACE